MADAVLLTPREISTGYANLNNNQDVLITDDEYHRLEPAMRLFYEKVRENLGLACISSYLRARGHSVRAVNLHGRMPSDETIKQMITAERPAFVGISIMYDLHIIDAVRLAQCARSAAPDVFIAIGGAFCTYNAKLIAEHIPEVDCVAYGEGELTVAGLLDALSSGSDWRSVPGIYYRDGENIRPTMPPKLPPLSEMPWPARDVLLHHRAAGIPTPVASSYTSRGCHAKCTFCYAPRQPGVVDGPWRIRPPEDVVDEIEYLQREFGTRFLWFNDDNFGGAFEAGFDHAMAFAEEVIRRDLKFSFHCEFRVDSGLIDKDILKTMRRAGMASALLGLETGAPGMMRRFKKGTTVEYNFDAARMFKELDIELDPGWIMIEPGTTLDELWENLEFIVAAGISAGDNPFFLINRAIALRGTEMYDKIEQPRTPTDIPNLEGPAGAVLGKARRDYVVADPRVELLWSGWSAVGVPVSERKENELPFLAQMIANASRARRGLPGDDTRELLGRLRRWRNGLADLLVAFLNTGLVLADHGTAVLEQRLETELWELVNTYDISHFEVPFNEFAEYVKQHCGEHADVRTVAS